MKVSIKILFMLIACFLAVGGCASTFSKKARELADRKISLAMIAENPQQYIGKVVVLGGDIVETVALENSTEIIVLEKPLYYDYRPKTAKARGRFIVVYRGFLDPAEWKPGTQVSFVGAVAEPRESKIGDKPYRYQVLDVIERQLWKPYVPQNYYYDPFTLEHPWPPTAFPPKPEPHR